MVGQVELSQAPARREPSFRDHKQHRFAAVGRLIEHAFPLLARHDPAVRVEVEEDFVFPAVIGEPVAQGDRLGIVAARMAEKIRDTPKMPEKEPPPDRSIKANLRRCQG